MTLQVVGAGVGRTGTMSLKTGLERLIGLPCYHMVEVFGRPEHVPLWKEAAEGGQVEWAAMLAGYGATSDFPACLFWREIYQANPNAMVVLSTRSDTALWWASASQTIFGFDDGTKLPPEMSDWFAMWGRRGIGPFHAELDGRGRGPGGLRAPQRRSPGLGAPGPAGGLATRARMGPALRRARGSPTRRTVPTLEHARGLPCVSEDFHLAEAIEQISQFGRQPLDLNRRADNRAVAAIICTGGSCVPLSGPISKARFTCSTGESRPPTAALIASLTADRASAALCGPMLLLMLGVLADRAPRDFEGSTEMGPGQLPRHHATPRASALSANVLSDAPQGCGTSCRALQLALPLLALAQPVLEVRRTRATVARRL